MSYAGKIPWEDFVHLAPSDPEEQVRVNHEGCTAGEDNRERLYIKRTEDGITILAYCHNCGLSGFYIEGFTNVTTLRKSGSSFGARSLGGMGLSNDTSFKETLKLPDGLLTSTSHWPDTACKIFRNMGGISSSVLRDYTISYDPRLRRLVYPLWTSAGLQGYQLRRVFDDDEYPKYLTERVSPWNKSGLINPLGEQWGLMVNPESPTPRSSRKHLVVVEDVISGLKVIEANSLLQPMVLLGTYIPLFGNLMNQDLFKSVTIWLDNDSPEVIEKAKKLRDKMLLGGRQNVAVVESKRDPKWYSNSEITATVRGHQGGYPEVALSGESR